MLINFSFIVLMAMKIDFLSIGKKVESKRDPLNLTDHNNYSVNEICMIEVQKWQ